MASPSPSTPNITLRGAFSSIKGLNFSKRRIRNGRELLDNLFNIQVEEKQASGNAVISARMMRTTSITETPYIVEFEVDKSRNIIRSSCRCVAGESALCKHGAALFIFINEERSEGKTDDKQVWHAPSKAALEKYPKGETTGQILGTGNNRARKGRKRKIDSQIPALECNPESEIHVQKEGSDEKCQKIADEMKQFGLTQSCLYKSLTADVSNVQRAPVVHEVIPNPHVIQRIFYRGGFARPCTNEPPPLIDDKCSLFYEQNIIKSDKEKYETFKNTRGQSTNRKWHEARENLVTASTAHKIMQAKSQEKACDYFDGDSADYPNFRYGRETEPRAIKHYSREHRVVVHESGLVICRHLPWLAASPDGLVVESHGELTCLEVKCPTSGRCGLLNVDFLEDNNTKLKRKHCYFAQIQLQMLACDSQLTHLYIFGNHDQILIEVLRDDEYLSKLVIKLESIYFKTLLPWSFSEARKAKKLKKSVRHR